MSKILASINLSTPAGIITIIVAVLLIFLAFKFLSGLFRIIITVALIAVIIFVIYFLLNNAEVIGRTIADLVPFVFFMRRKNGRV